MPVLMVFHCVTCIAATGVRVVGWILQPAVVPHSHHAEHRTQERAAPRQNVSTV